MKRHTARSWAQRHRAHRALWLLSIVLLLTGTMQTLATAQSNDQNDSIARIDLAVVSSYGPTDGSLGESLWATLHDQMPGTGLLRVRPDDAAAIVRGVEQSSSPGRLVLVVGASFGDAVEAAARNHPATTYVWIDATRRISLVNVTTVVVDANGGAEVLADVVMASAVERVGLLHGNDEGMQANFTARFRSVLEAEGITVDVAPPTSAFDTTAILASTQRLTDDGAQVIVSLGPGSDVVAAASALAGVGFVGLGPDHVVQSPDAAMASFVLDWQSTIGTVLIRHDQGLDPLPSLFVGLGNTTARITTNTSHPLVPSDIGATVDRTLAELAGQSTLIAAPTSTPLPTPTPEPTAEPTATPDPAATPTATPDPTAVPDPTATPDPAATPEPTATPQVSTAAQTGAVDPTPTPTPTPDATLSPTPTVEPTVTATPEATAEPTPTLVAAGAGAGAASGEILAITGSESSDIAGVGLALIATGFVLACMAELMRRISSF